jgi:Asp-tRNA(Asn)/Glu-tRNA(Gln) amidotransferase A subunit family amidase
MTDDLSWATATEMSARIQARELSPVEVVDVLLERIATLDEELNHFCFVYGDEAREAARRAEDAVMRRSAHGPLHGVPYALKDFTPTRGLTTTLGSRAYRDWVPDDDAPVAERLRAAGGILLGKTLTPEFAYSGFTHSPLWGVARNPWDRARNTGGSSGGSAGAVAAGMVPLAEGSDAGGSIRIPASFCGVVGFKPSLGRVPVHLTPNDFDSIWHVGPIARSVGDVVLMFSVMHGPDERDPLSVLGAVRADSPEYTLTAIPRGAGSAGPQDMQGLRLALSVDLGYYDIDPEVEANTRAAAEALRDAGAEVVEVDLGWSEEINHAWSKYWNVALAALYDGVATEHRSVMDPEVVAMIEEGRRTSAVELKSIELLRSRQWEAIRPVLENHHALLCPTTAVTAPAAESTEASYRRAAPLGRFGGYELACPFNFIGQCPVISVPSGFDSAGLPTGLQIVGRRYDDTTVLRIARALERLRPWASHRPAL